MTTRTRLAGTLLVAGMLLGACGDDDADSTITVEDARDEVCRTGTAYVEELDRYGRLIDDDPLTVGAVASAGSGLDEASETVLTALDELEAANEAAEVTESTVPIADESRTRVDEAQDDLTEALEDIDDGDALLDVTVSVSSAAFQLQVAWQVLLAESGCLDDPDETLEQLREYVAGVQTDLATLDLYGGPIDGIYGPLTIEAVRTLQEQVGLPETGLLDRATQAALAEQLGERESAQVAALQGLLIGLGYWPPPADGVWTDALGDALALLQADLGLEPTGTIDPATVRALQDALASGGAEAPTTTAPAATDPPATDPPATDPTTTAPPTTAPPTTAPPTTTAPPATAPPSAPTTIVDVLAADGRFTTLVAALSTAGLTDRFVADELSTLFAPTDDAFAALPAGELDALLADPAALGQILLGHTVERAALLTGFLSQVGTVPTASGATLTFGGSPEALSVNGVAVVVSGDIRADNGVVHAVDALVVAPA